MNIASLELCKELYELSSWDETEKMHWKPTPLGNLDSNKGVAECPAYDLDYLLTKIPHHISGYHLDMWAYPDEDTEGFAFSYYAPLADGGKGAVAKNLPQRGDKNPTNAACKLTIELIKQGVIKI